MAPKLFKKPAMTVVAKAELAQSYMAHPHIAFFCWSIGRSFQTDIIGRADS
jgi:hypothetical protein